MALTPETECSAPTCDNGTLTENPFQSVLNECRSVYVIPAAAAFALNASCSALSVEALPPLTEGGLLSSTNHAVGLSLPAPLAAAAGWSGVSDGSGGAGPARTHAAR